MLRTYFRQKFRKVAPSLVVLQLFAFLCFLVYQKYSEPKLPDLEIYSIFLENNNQIWWNELSYEVAYFEHRMLMEGAGKELVESSNKVLDIAGKYHKKILFFQEKVDSIRGESSFFLTVQQKAEKEQKILEIVRLEKWYEQIEQNLQDYREELKQQVLQLNEYSMFEQWEIRREILYADEVLDKFYLNVNFEQQGQIELRLSTIQMILMNIAKRCVNFIYSRVAIDSIIFEECMATVVPSVKTLYEGETFEANIFLSQRATFVPQCIVIDRDTLKKDRFNGAVYRVIADKVGIHTFEGKIHVKNQYGREDIFPFQYEYTVLPKCN